MHKSQEVDITVIDNRATLIDLGGIKRIVYSEENGALMTLDVGDSWVQFKREEAWITHAVFHKLEPSKLYIISEEGELRFDIKVLNIATSPQKVIIEYELLQGTELIDTHLYAFEWTEEEESWLGAH